MQPEPSTPQESRTGTPVTPQPQFRPAPVPAKNTGINIFMILFFILLLFSILACGGFGFWTWQLNTNLKTTQADLAALQGKYDTLTVEKNTLSTNLDQIAKELEQTKLDLEQAKADLAKSEDETAALRTKMDKALKYVEVMMGIWSDDDTFSETQIKVRATNDATNLSLYEKYMNSRNTTDLGNWFEYFFEAMFDILK